MGLVLGAGGLVGQAYQAGALAALEHDLGWDPRTADLIVGTSAGAVTGALLRLGVPAHDLAAAAVAAPLSLESAGMRDLLEGDRPRLPPVTPSCWLRPWRPPSYPQLRSLVRRPWALRPFVLACTMMPVGRVDLLDHTSALDDACARAWPQGLWLCAVRRDDGRRVVFGRTGLPPEPLSACVAASCAIPGFFSPVRIGDVEYLDGGVASRTNADVLGEEDLDVVIAVAPMSAAHGTTTSIDAVLRWGAHVRLERELAAAHARGATVVRIEPGREALAAMGVNMMADDRAEAVVQAAFIDTGQHIGQPRIGARLAGLRSRS